MTIKFTEVPKTNKNSVDCFVHTFDFEDKDEFSVFFYTFNRINSYVNGDKEKNYAKLSNMFIDMKNRAVTDEATGHVNTILFPHEMATFATLLCYATYHMTDMYEDERAFNEALRRVSE